MGYFYKHYLGPVINGDFMTKTLLLALLIFIVSCAGMQNNSRKLASVEKKNLTGTLLGVASYPSGHKGPNMKAVRVYFVPVEGKENTYTVVLLEYVNLLKMAPSYIASNKLPIVARATGFLKNITDNISTYEATPGSKEGTYDLAPLVVEGDQIVVNKNAPVRVLTLSNAPELKHPLQGATLSSANTTEPTEIYFPYKGDKKKHGIQYGTAKLAYEKAKLESTWRKEFLRGPYLSQYYRKDDVVLKLLTPNDAPNASFIINEKMSRMDQKKRAKMFTSEKSAFLKGDFAVTEPRDGMFLFKPTTADDSSKEIMKGRVGLFIDIFDATISLKQDVVELCIINPENPADFLMYYEHPQNGEGKYASPQPKYLLIAHRKAASAAFFYLK